MARGRTNCSFVTVVAFLLGVFLIDGCSAGSIVQADAGDAAVDSLPATGCTVGMVISCPCLGGGMGVQTCIPGRSYGACMCASDAGVGVGDVMVSPPADSGSPTLDVSIADSGARTLDAPMTDDTGSAISDAATVDSGSPSLDAPMADSGSMRGCVVGMVISCPCLGGGTGVQTCVSGGTYGACMCASDAGMTPPIDTGVSASSMCAPLPAAVPCPSISDCAAALAVTGMSAASSGSEAQQEASSFSAWACNTANTEQVLDSANSTGVSASYGEIGLSISASVSHSEQLMQVQSWQMMDCASQVSSASASTVSSLLSSIVNNQPSLSAWVSCVSQVSASYQTCIASQNSEPSGLIIVFDNAPIAGGVFTVRVRWCGTGGDISIASATVVQPLTLIDASCMGLSTLTTGAPLGIGDITFPCTRTTAGEVLATMSVSVSVAGASRGYSAENYLESLCGGMGQVCCDVTPCGVGLDCTAGICQTCGNLGDPCCPGNICVSGQTCVGSVCDACGAAGQPCCPGMVCATGSACSSGTCTPCGGHGGPCCPGNVCLVGMDLCASGICGCTAGVLCGGTCTDTQTDSANCGMCGTVCPMGLCVGGRCINYNSTGADGAFAPTSNTVLAAGVYNYTTVTIPAGVTVNTNGTGVLDVRAASTVTINGVIDVSGAAGCWSGGTTGNPSPPSGVCTVPTNYSSQGGGGGSGATGMVGGSSYMLGGDAISTSSLGGSFGGGGSGNMALGYASSFAGGEGGGGGGYAGGGGGSGYECDGHAVGACGAYAPSAAGAAGVGGSSSDPNYNGGNGALFQTSSGNFVDPDYSGCGGGGGGSIGSDAVADLAVASTFRPGSGGGGGISYCNTGGVNGGGGGAGGAIRVTSPVSITLGVGAELLANGGDGGTGSGGGGSGGVIYLQAPTIAGMARSAISAVGGAGGTMGGNGGLGRIRLSTGSVTGIVFTPPLPTGANASGYCYVTPFGA